MLNQRLVRDGYAREYDYRDQPYTYRTQFRMAQNQAAQHHYGLWGECSRN
ncbi:MULTISPECIES: thermonuclease family protein [Gordonia]